jgi:hypothetical protein
MKKKDVLIDLKEDVQDKVKKLNRLSYYFIKGHKMDDVPVQLTHFYKDHLRFKVVAFPTPSKIPDEAVLRLRFRDKGLEIKKSRLKFSRPPALKVCREMSKKEKIRRTRHNKSRPTKAFINLRYSTLMKAPYISFDEIDYSDLPLFMGSSREWTHLKEILGF